MSCLLYLIVSYCILIIKDEGKSSTPLDHNSIQAGWLQGKFAARLSMLEQIVHRDARMIPIYNYLNLLRTVILQHLKEVKRVLLVHIMLLRSTHLVLIQTVHQAVLNKPRDFLWERLPEATP